MQVDPGLTALGFSTLTFKLHMMNCFQTLLSISTCACTERKVLTDQRAEGLAELGAVTLKATSVGPGNTRHIIQRTLNPLLIYGVLIRMSFVCRKDRNRDHTALRAIPICPPHQNCAARQLIIITPVNVASNIR